MNSITEASLSEELQDTQQKQVQHSRMMTDTASAEEDVTLSPSTSVVVVDDPISYADSISHRMEQFLNEDASGGFTKENGGFRQKMMQRRILSGAIILIMLAALVGLFVLLFSGPKETKVESKSIAAATGHDYMLTAQMLKSPAYTGDLDPSGRITMAFDEDNHFLITAKVSGLEEYCEGCSLVVYSGTTCTDATLLGEPLWNHQKIGTDPWDRVHYHAVKGITGTAVASYIGLTPEEIMGHIVIMNGSQGQLLACGVLDRDDSPRQVKTLYAALENLAPYSMTNVHGIVSIQFFPDDTFIFNIDLHGLPHLCSQCEISIQEGTSCDPPSQIGSHNFDRFELEKDPFASARGSFYTSDNAGNSKRSFFLYNGYGYADNLGKTILVKAADKSRIACGVLGAHKITPKPQHVAQK